MSHKGKPRHWLKDEKSGREKAIIRPAKPVSRPGPNSIHGGTINQPMVTIYVPQFARPRVKRSRPIPTQSIAELYGTNSPMSETTIDNRRRLAHWQERKAAQRARAIKKGRAA